MKRSRVVPRKCILGVGEVAVTAPEPAAPVLPRQRPGAMTLPRGWRIILLWLIAWTPLRAMVLFGNLDSDNLLRPLNGAPWGYVAMAQFRNTNGVLENQASAIYLGNRFALTAVHVGRPDHLIFPRGEFTPDTNSAPIRVDHTDLLLFRLTSDPGLPPLVLAPNRTEDMNQTSTLIGCGVGRGITIGGWGWLWGNQRVRRWGTNVTLNFLETGDDYGELLVTAFDVDAGADEAQPTHGDSGGGLFQQHRGTWMLAGVMVTVDSAGAFYDHDDQEPGLQPDQAYYERIQSVRREILEKTGLPDASSAQESWRWWHFQQLTGTGPAADTADPDLDGISNFLEFAFGLDPYRADADRLPQAFVANDLFTLNFEEPEYMSGVAYAAEVSHDLQHWAPLPDADRGIQHRWEIPLNSSTAGFVRWKVAITHSATTAP